MITTEEKSEDEIQDAEVVEEDEETTTDSQPADSENAAVSQINLESLINRYLKDIEGVREKLKMQKTMLDDAFNNDAGYAEANQKVKEATKVRNGVKQKIQKQPAIIKVTSEINALKDEMKDLQEGLSQYLQQYMTQSGNNQFTGEGGEVLEIVVSRRLVRKNSKYRP
jgi:hypothetical protein